MSFVRMRVNHNIIKRYPFFIFCAGDTSLSAGYKDIINGNRTTFTFIYSLFYPKPVTGINNIQRMYTLAFRTCDTFFANYLLLDTPVPYPSDALMAMTCCMTTSIHYVQLIIGQVASSELRRAKIHIVVDHANNPNAKEFLQKLKDQMGMLKRLKIQNT